MDLSLSPFCIFLFSIFFSLCALLLFLVQFLFQFSYMPLNYIAFGMFSHFCPYVVHSVCVSHCVSMSWYLCLWCVFCPHVCVLLNWINSAGSSLGVEKSLPAVTSVSQLHTHAHTQTQTVEYFRIGSDGESDEGIEGRERMVLRSND